mmetsp:Transcript_115364/g.337293  ORF Transcript_115364/g.337293 Transcript_115364/m.337293 type:complete len:244 (-) Transcript_115364:211-942(-)
MPMAASSDCVASDWIPTVQPMNMAMDVQIWIAGPSPPKVPPEPKYREVPIKRPSAVRKGMYSPVATATRDWRVPPPHIWNQNSGGRWDMMVLYRSAPMVATTMYTALSGNCPSVTLVINRGKIKPFSSMFRNSLQPLMPRGHPAYSTALCTPATTKPEMAATKQTKAVSSRGRLRPCSWSSVLWSVLVPIALSELKLSLRTLVDDNLERRPPCRLPGIGLLFSDAMLSLAYRPWESWESVVAP